MANMDYPIGCMGCASESGCGLEEYGLTGFDDLHDGFEGGVTSGDWDESEAGSSISFGKPSGLL